MAVQTTMLHVRVDDDTKTRVTAAVGEMGLAVLDAVRLFLRRVVAEQIFPLELKVPNAETRAAMAEAEELLRNRRSSFANAEDLFADLEKAGGK